MSTSVSRRSSATGHPTRQQLDELDALLKRMLDLPVNRLEDEAEAPAPAADVAPQPVVSPPEPMRGPHRPAARPPAEPPAVNYRTPEDDADLRPRVVTDEAPASDKPADWVPLSSAWQPSARTWKPLSEAWKQAQTAAGRPAETPAVESEPALAPEAPPEPQAEMPMAPAVAPEPLSSEAAEAPHVPASGPAWLLWPLLGFNTAFDACLIPFGPAGRLLRGRVGRMVLGVVGLLALAAAAALTLADWFGWTG